MSDTHPLGPASAVRQAIAEFPCTQTQLRCWFLDQLSPGNPALNVAVRWEIRGVFKTTTIEEAFRRIIGRHEILRTRFVDVNGQPVQQVVETVDFRMPVIDLRNVPAEQREARIQEIGKETAAAPFDLGKAGLLRVTFLMVENQRGILLITAHQSCFDGWSIRVLGREVGTMAAALDAGRAADLPELPLQYGDFALWQAEYRNSYGFDTEKAYWREQLKDAPYFEIRPDRPRGRLKTSCGEILSIPLSKAFSERIDAAARAHRVSVFSLGAAVLSAALNHYSGARDVLFGTQIAGREEIDLESLIGVFINNLVLRFDVDDHLTFAEHLARVAATVEAALSHQKMPFNNLVELINPVRDPSRNPLISINFNQQKAFLEDTPYGGFELISAPSQSPGVIYDLNFIMIARPTGWRMSVEYNTDLFDRTTAEELLDLWQKAYAFALADPHAALGTMPGARRAPPKPATPQTVPSRLDAVLAERPEVDEVCVARSRATGRLHAFVTPAPDCTLPLDALPARLMAALDGRLAQEAMPSGISVLLTLPKTIDGAIDLRALPTPASPATKPARAPAGPRPINGHEEKLAEIWARVLGVDQVAGADDFFALGGHSLLALRMFSAMHDTFGLKPDLATLFKEPTLSGFARAVFGQTPAAPTMPTDEPATAQHNSWQRSVYRQGTGGATVYTLNHPFLYFRMAQALPEAASVMNLNLFNAELTTALRTQSLEEIAAEAIAAMEIGPEPRPVALVGLCVNGVLAMEMARQLRQAGNHIAFIALIDSWAPGYVRAKPRFTRWRWNTEKRIKRLSYFTGKLAARRMPLRAYLKSFRLTLRLLERFGSRPALTAEEQANGDVTALLVDAVRRYRPRSAGDEPVLFFRSRANHRRAGGMLFGWRGFVPDDSPVFDLDGWHEDSLADGGVETLAEVLSGHLETGGSAGG